MSITARELAKVLGLSQTAISLALNNKPGVSAETRRLVIDEATKRGYDFGRIKGRQTKSSRIGVVIGPYFLFAKLDNTVFSEVITGAQMTCREQKHQTELIQLTSDQLKGEGLELVLMDLRQKDFDGLLLVGADIPKDSVRSFMKLHIPLVLIDAYYPDLPCNAVTVDNLNGGRLAATYLCDRYHCEPWYLRCRYRADSFNDRIAGFMEAIRDRALSRRKVEVLTISPSTEDARDDVLTFVEENKGIPRCLFAETDQLALGAAQAFLSLGLRIPEDVAIVGFDNIVPAREFNPALTTIDYPKAFMGIEAAKKLLDLVSHPTEYVTNTKVAVSLVQRASA